MQVMTWLALTRYLVANWQPFLVASTVGIASGALLPTWFLSKDWIGHSVAYQSPAVYIGLISLTVAVLVSGWRRTVDFWSRYRRTLALDQPPIQQIDLAATGIFTAIVTGFFVLLMSVVRLTVSNSSYFGFLALLFLFFIWLLSSWVRSYKTTPAKDSPTNLIRHHGDYTDDPITSDEEDILGRVPFVDRLLAQILKLPSPSSFVFGLYGSWEKEKPQS
jgi:hypothetical protein